MIGPEDHSRWRPWLLAGERLLWSGRPKRGLVFRLADLYMVPLGLLWFALSVGLDSRNLLADAPWAFGPWAMLMGVFGLYLLTGGFLHEAFLRARLFYAVTDQRVLVLRTGRFRGGLKSIEIEYLPMLELRERGDGRGTLVFDPGEDKNTWGGHGTGRSPALAAGARFYRIEQPRLVYELVRKQAERRRREIAGDLPPHRAFIG
jgi:hypothetical protein